MNYGIGKFLVSPVKHGKREHIGGFCLAPVGLVQCHDVGVVGDDHGKFMFIISQGV